MKMLETIHLRSHGEPIESLINQILQSVEGKLRENKVVTLYRRTGLKTDIAVHIQCRESKEEGPSEIGIQLASALKTFGLVKHTIWEEMNSTVVKKKEK